MPVNYQLPSWLAQQAAPNPAEAYIQNLRVGAQIGMEKSRLQQENEIARMQADAKRQEMERRAAMDAQQLEVARAYHQQQNELKLAELNQQQELITAKATEAARRFSAQQRYRQRYTELTASGIEPDRAAATAALENAGELGISPTEIGAFSKALHPKTILPPSFMKSPGGAEIAVDQQTGSFKALSRPPVSEASRMQRAANTEELKGAYADIKKAKEEIDKLPEDIINDWPNQKTEDKKKWQAQMDRITAAQQKIARLQQGAQTPPTEQAKPAEKVPIEQIPPEVKIKALESQKKSILSNYLPGEDMTDAAKAKVDKIDGAIAALKTTPAPAAAPAAKTRPKPGDVYKGYRFKGGDPSKKENWEKAE